MKAIEAKEIAKKSLARLDVVTDDIMDDGRDSGNVNQNRRFCKNVNIIDDVEKTLARIEIDDIENSSVRLDAEWYFAGKDQPTSLPEGRYNRAVRYAHFLINYIPEK